MSLQNCHVPCKLYTFKASLSSAEDILAHNSSQHTFSSAVATRAEQRANALYSRDQVLNMVFWVI